MDEATAKCEKCNGEYYTEDLDAGVCEACNIVRIYVCENTETLVDGYEVPTLVQDSMAREMGLAAWQAIIDCGGHFDPRSSYTHAMWHGGVFTQGPGAQGHFWTREKPAEAIEAAIEKGREAMKEVAERYEIDYHEAYIEELDTLIPERH